jgi:hypothetical protein
MKAGKLVHRTVSPEQATLLRAAIANYRKARKLHDDHGFRGNVIANSSAS